MTPLILRLVARYGPKMLNYMSKQAPYAVKKVAPTMTSSMEAFQGLKRISPQMLSGASNLMKQYPFLFNSTSSRINHGNAMQLYKALKKFKGPDLRKVHKLLDK